MLHLIVTIILVFNKNFFSKISINLFLNKTYRHYYGYFFDTWKGVRL
jgi:hypothetical protein